MRLCKVCGQPLAEHTAGAVADCLIADLIADTLTPTPSRRRWWHHR